MKLKEIIKKQVLLEERTIALDTVIRRLGSDRDFIDTKRVLIALKDEIDNELYKINRTLDLAGDIIIAEDGTVTSIPLVPLEPSTPCPEPSDPSGSGSSDSTS